MSYLGRVCYNKLSNLCNKFKESDNVLKNNVEIDVKVKCMEEGITQAQLAEKVGTSAPYVNRIIKGSNILNKTFLSMMEKLGYDVKFTYVKREN